MIGRLIVIVMGILLVAGLALVGYAYVGPVFFPQDFAAPTLEVTQPVTLDLEE